MEATLRMPVSYNVLSCEEMTYTEGGANATLLQAVCSWVIPFYGWYKTTTAVRDYRKQHPNTWTDTGLDAVTNHMDRSVYNLAYDIGCAVDFFQVCATGFGLIPTALIIFGK